VSGERAHAGTRGQRVRQPFPGARPFRRADTPVFFGRETEAEQIRSLWLSERTVVLAGPQAVGKTSLLLAGMLPALISDEAVDVLPVGRVAAASADAGFVPTLLRSLTRDRRRPTAARTLLEFLTDRAVKVADRGDHPPTLAAIDQFEDVFATGVGILGLERLLAELIAAVTEVPDFHLLLVMRQDALALLAEHGRFSELRPHIVSLRPLAHDDAVEAIAGPAGVSGVPLASGVAEQLVDDLRTVTFEDAVGRDRVEYTEGVEPLHLQITCRRLWASLPSKAEIVTGDLLRAYGGVDSAITGFYDVAVRESAARAGVDEGRLHDWVRRTFVTEIGTRDSVQQGFLAMGGLPEKVVGELAARQILTVEHKAGEVWYQLSHDRLAYAVIMSGGARAKGRDVGQDRVDDSGSARSPLAAAARDWRSTADARVQQADIARSKGDPAEADRYLRAALSIFLTLEDPYSAARLLTAIAELRFAAGDYTGAADLNRQAVERAPGDVMALTGLAYALWQGGSPADAEATFGQALRWDSGTALALAGRGQIRADLGRYQYALDDLDRALRLTLARDTEADARSARALALAGLGRVAEAERELSATVQLAPDRARTRLRAGRIAAILGRWDEVRAQIELALSGRPSLSSVERESAKLMMQRTDSVLHGLRSVEPGGVGRVRSSS